MEEYDLKWNRKEKIEIEQKFSGCLIKTNEKWEKFFLFKLVLNKKLVYEFLAESEEEIAFWKYREGILYWHKRILGCYISGLHLQARVENSLNVCLQGESVYILQGNTISKFYLKQKYRRAKGLYKLPLIIENEIINLFKIFKKKELIKSFLYGWAQDLSIIASLNKVAIIKENQIIQTVHTSSDIIEIKEKSIETINKVYFFEKKAESKTTNLKEFIPNKKTLLALSQFSRIDEVIDLFFFKNVSNLEKKLTNDWHLDPLDRGVLSSDKFYQEKFYDYIEKYLNLTVQGLFITNPDKLLMLQEALREQEVRIYKDGHLQPEKTISSLITYSLPLPSKNDTILQSNVRSLFLNSLKKPNV